MLTASLSHHARGAQSVVLTFACQLVVAATDRHTILAPFAPVNAPSNPANPAATRHSARFAAPSADRRLHAVTLAC